MIHLVEALKKQHPDFSKVRFKESEMEKFLFKNKEYILNGMNKYYGGHGINVTNYRFRCIFAGKDSKGNLVKGVHLVYANEEGKWNLDAYISLDGYVVEHSYGFPEYDINEYNCILPELYDKLKKAIG